MAASLRTLLIFLLTLTHVVHAELLVMTHTYNQPELIYWQNATFKKFLKDDYQFVVFNDAPDAETSQETRALCDALEIQCIDVPQSIHNHLAPYLPGSRNPFGDPSAECADTIQYMLDTLGFDHPGIVAVFDSDMFLIREISIEKEMQEYAIGGHPQYRQGSHERITYLLPNLVFLDMRKLPDKRSLNFNVGRIDGVNVDTGGYTYYYLQQHPKCHGSKPIVSPPPIWKQGPPWSPRY